MGLGAQFVNEAERTVATLAGSPGLGAPVPGQDALRRWPLRRFPYYVLYNVDGAALLILAVAHERRRPGYWGERS